MIVTPPWSAGRPASTSVFGKPSPIPLTMKVCGMNSSGLGRTFVEGVRDLRRVGRVECQEDFLVDVGDVERVDGRAPAGGLVATLDDARGAGEADAGDVHHAGDDEVNLVEGRRLVEREVRVVDQHRQTVVGLRAVEDPPVTAGLGGIELERLLEQRDLRERRAQVDQRRLEVPGRSCRPAALRRPAAPASRGERLPPGGIEIAGSNARCGRDRC